VGGAIEQPTELLPPGAVENQKPLTLDDLEAMALANNPTLASAASRIQAARGQWTQVGLPPNPVIGYSGDEIGNEGRAGQQGGFVGQQIVTGGKLRLSRSVAAQEIQVAEAQLEAQRLRVANDVRINFYDVLVTQRRIEIGQDIVQIGERAIEAVEKFLQVGESNRVDLLQARVEVNSARILMENARNDHEATWRKLAAAVGMPDMQPAPLAGDLQSDVADITFASALQRLLENSPELAAAQVNVSRARQAVARARAEAVPNVDLQAGVQYDNATEDTIANVQVGLPIPVWNRNQGGIRRAEAELATARNETQRMELNLQHRLASAYQRYANARQQVTTYKEQILPDAQTSLDLVTQGYQQGEFGYLALLTSQRTYFQTNLAYLEAVRQLRESAIAIDGLLLTDSLTASEQREGQNN
jgi:cobalt-zinc-cadmium efflux system outer membrane protein